MKKLTEVYPEGPQFIGVGTKLSRFDDMFIVGANSPGGTMKVGLVNLRTGKTYGQATSVRDYAALTREEVQHLIGGNSLSEFSVASPSEFKDWAINETIPF